MHCHCEHLSVCILSLQKAQTDRKWRNAQGNGVTCGFHGYHHIGDYKSDGCAVTCTASCLYVATCADMCVITVCTAVFAQDEDRIQSRVAAAPRYSSSNPLNSGATYAYGKHTCFFEQLRIHHCSVIVGLCSRARMCAFRSNASNEAYVDGTCLIECFEYF